MRSNYELIKDQPGFATIIFEKKNIRQEVEKTRWPFYLSDHSGVVSTYQLKLFETKQRNLLDAFDLVNDYITVS